MPDVLGEIVPGVGPNCEKVRKPWVLRLKRWKIAMLCYGYGYAMLCYALLQQQSPPHPHPTPRAPFSCLDLSCSSHHPPIPACIVLCCAMLWCTHNSYVKSVADKHNAHEEGNEASSINIKKELICVCCAMLYCVVLCHFVLCYADVTC